MQSHLEFKSTAPVELHDMRVEFKQSGAVSNTDASDATGNATLHEGALEFDIQSGRAFILG